MKTSFKVEQWAVDRPVPYAKNPRRNEAAVAKVTASLREYGFRQPIVVDEAGVVIAGHTRLLAAKAGDIVLDPFSGSGSTLIACETANLKARCLELSPAYCDVIVTRWETATGKPAVRP